MGKELSEMTLEELWQLFPIILKEHNEHYKEWYEIEKNRLTTMLAPEDIVRIEHIGSTAVKGLIAKPTVDILLEIDGGCDTASLKETLRGGGWGLMNEASVPVWEQTYNMGYTKEGFAEKVYHLHVRYFGDWDELYFRDYLTEHPEAAEKYGELKLKLLSRYEHDRDGYTGAKTEFVRHYSKLAKAEYPGRYHL